MLYPTLGLRLAPTCHRLIEVLSEGQRLQAAWQHHTSQLLRIEKAQSVKPKCRTALLDLPLKKALFEQAPWLPPSRL